MARLLLLESFLAVFPKSPCFVGLFCKRDLHSAPGGMVEMISRLTKWLNFFCTRVFWLSFEKALVF